MKRLSFLLSAGLISALALTTTSCEDETVEPTTLTVDSSQPQGDVTVVGVENTFTPESGKPTTGKAAIITDANGDHFVRLDEDFNTDLATGTVTVFLAKSSTGAFSPNPDTSEQVAIGVIGGAGKAYYKLSSAPDAAYTHVILWCGTVGVPFGNAQVQ